MVQRGFDKFNQLLSENNSSMSWAFLQDLLDEYDPIMDILLTEQMCETRSEKYSRYCDINESFEHAREFLYCVDKSLGERFDCLTRCFIDGKPIYTFRPVEDSIDKENSFENGFINISYENTPRDAKNIVHETFHLFNYRNVDANGRKIVNLTTKLFTELVSILAEKLYIAFAYTKNYIDGNDVALLLNERIDNTYLSIHLTKCERQYLELNKRGVYIDHHIIEEIKNQYKGAPIYEDYWIEECKNHTVIENAVIRGKLTYPTNLSYILGEYYSNLIIDLDKNSKEILVELNELITNLNVKYNDVVERCLEKRLKQ